MLMASILVLNYFSLFSDTTSRETLLLGVIAAIAGVVAGVFWAVGSRGRTLQTDCAW
jgi:hypothetical protein